MSHARDEERPSLILICSRCSYADLKKIELESALDGHLRANSSIFSGDKRLADYYRRLSQPGRVSSPVKKEPKSETALVPSDEPKKTMRRRKADADAVYVFPATIMRRMLTRRVASTS
jgi:hypothetical protein